VGKMLDPVPESPVPRPTSTVKLAPLTRDDCRIQIPGAHDSAKIRTIRGVRFTSWGELDVDVIDGFAELPPSYGVILVQHRHGRHSAPPRTAVLEGWGDLHGAIATTYSHDSHNLVVLGKSPTDIQAAANALIACGGGLAVAKNGKVIAIFEMPIAGMLSAETPQQAAEAYRQLRAAAGQVVDWLPPYRVFKAIEGTSLACNPGPHLTDLGLTDGSTHEIVGMIMH
jgi:adenine deaminase